MKRPATALPVLALALLAGCGGAPVGGPDAVDGPDFELRVRRDGANASARADTSSATLAQRMSIRTPFVYWDERPHPAMPANQHLVLISVVIEPNGPTWLNDIALQCDAAAVRQVWALVGGQRVGITPIDMDGPGAYAYADDLLQAHDGGPGAPLFAQTAERRAGGGSATDYTIQAGTISTWTFGTAGPAQSLPGYAANGVTQRDPDVGMAWGFLIPDNATEVCVGGDLLGTGRTAANGPVGYVSVDIACWMECWVTSSVRYRSLPGARQAPLARQMYTNQPINDLAFTWDGSHIAFSQGYLYDWDEVGTHTVCIGTSSAKGAVVVCEGRWPCWSPDGSQIAFQRKGPSGTSAIWVADATAGAEPRVLYDDPAGEEICPAWHPNGSCIAFTSTKDGGYRLYRMAPDGTGVAPLGDLVGWKAAWSFDGRMLAYERNMYAHVANADGSGDRFIAYGEAPRWSPSGRSLLVLRPASAVSEYMAFTGLVRALYCLDVETGAGQFLVGPGYAGGPDPSRSGACLAITAGAWKPVPE